MNIVLRKISISVSRTHGSWLTLLLLLVVLAPSVCLLWFMHRAVQNERLAVRQKLVDAYRGHLSLAQERLDSYWRQTAGDMETQAQNLPPAECFAQFVRAGLADAVVLFDSASKVVYPLTVLSPKSEAIEASWTEAQGLEETDPEAAANEYARLAERTTNAGLAARALQAQARCLSQAGKKAAAITVLLESLGQERYRRAMDLQGRLLVPNAELMALELTIASDPQRARGLLESLKQRLLDYRDASLPAPQRRFLMHEVQRLFPDQEWFPTLAAEDLAARYLETGVVLPQEPAFHATPLAGVWQFASSHRRVVMLHRSENLAARMRQLISSPAFPSGVEVDFLAPGQEVEGSLLSLPAGSSLPGWRLSLGLKDQQLFDTATRNRIAWDVWMGILVVGTVAVLALIALRLVRRQTALTQLKNDLVANVTHELKTPLSSMRLLVDTLLNSEPLQERTAREYLQLIAQENERLSRLIDNFLTFSRIERNKYAFDFERLPPAKIVEGATAAVRERLHTAGCRLDIQIPPDLPPVVADADALVTALLNLLENACKYSGDQKQIELSVGVQNGSVFFAVKDHGIGLSPRDTKQIFKRFYQVDQRLSRTGGGCGLGLSIVNFIVRAHGGTVRVESQPGCGSVFTMTLPVAGPGLFPKAIS